MTVDVWVYFWAVCSVPLIHISVFVPIPHFVVLSEVWEGYASGFALAILGLLWFHINFRIICSSSVKNDMGNLIGITLNL